MVFYSELEYWDEVMVYLKGQDVFIVRMMVFEIDEFYKEIKKIFGKMIFGEILYNYFINVGKVYDFLLGIEMDRWFVILEKGGMMFKYEDFEGCDVLLIMGSVYDVYGDDLWILDLLKLLRGGF